MSNERKPAWKKQNNNNRQNRYNKSRPPRQPRKPREVKVGPLEAEVINGDIERAIKELKNKMSKEGVITELKHKRFAEKPSEKKRRKHREALKKMRKSRGKKARQYKRKEQK